jgi:hypothetical protein
MGKKLQNTRPIKTARYSGSSIRAPCGRKVLSAHWFLQVGTALFWHHEGCARVALRIFLFDFNPPSDGARNVRRGGAILFFRYRAR